MATISNIKQRDIASMFTENEQKAIYNEAVERYEKEQKESQNKGGFFGGLGYLGEKIGLGFLSAVEGIWDYTAGGLAKLFGADDWAEQQFANDWVNYNHADEWYNPSDGWKVAGDVAGGIGSSLPSMAALAVVGWATGGAAVPAMITTFLTSGLSAAGNATKEAYRETGELGGKEFGYGALSGVTEGAVETFSDMVLAGVGGKITKAFNKDVVSTVATKTLGKEIAKSFLSEGFEEVIGTVTEPYWKRLTYDKDAENASFQEIGYAALVGGLSGAIMTGVGGGWSNARSVAKGNNVVKTGTTSTVLQQAQSIQTYETQNHTENEVFEAVSSTYNELQQSLAKTNGEVQTVKQKMLLGRLQSLNTQAIFQPTITTSAENIFNNAEEIASRMNQYGYKDASGNPITITAEQIRQGINTTNAKTFKKSMVNALKSNSVLRTLSVLDATGQIMIDTVKYKEAALAGQSLSSQVDLNRFIETATDSELQAVGEKLGIDNWQGLTSAEFQEKITDFARNGGIEAYKNERLIVKDADSISADTAQKLPSKIDMQENGIKRYYLGDSQVAIIKDGDNYRIYDYSSKRLSKVLTESELNKVLKQLNTQEKSVADSVKQQLETESELKRQAAKIDEYARENISEYKTLNAPSQSMIRQIIRNGRAAGVSEDFVLTTARVSARSGLNIVFSKEASFVTANGTYADGAIDLKNNQIIINPDAKNRTGEMILIHELTHAIYNLDGGVLQVAEGLETMTDAEKKSITDRYTKIGKGSAIEVSDEINAHFAEQTLSNKNILERLVAKKPTVKGKILKFFKKSSVDYSEDAKLTGAAKKLFKQYQKLFNDFSARNQGNNATEINTNKGLDSYALAKDEKNGYNNQKGVENGKENSKQETREERNGLGNVQGRQRANQVGTLREFSKDSKKAKLENSTDRLEYLKILKEGGHTQVKIDNQGVNRFISFIEIKEDALLPVLKDIRAENEKIGFKTKYTVSGFNINGDNVNYDNVLGLYSTNSDTIYIKLSDSDITNTNNHERLHNVESKYPEIYNAFRAEVKQIFGGDYSKAVDYVAKDWGLAEFSLKESEFLAEFFAGGERIDFGTEIDAKRDFIVEKYRKILAQKGKLDNLRYALPETDSNGTKLSQKQREYFADSKVIDKNGNLRVVYHGSKTDITEFDSKFTSKWNAYGDGFYFTSDKSRGERYAKGKLLETYLDIKTPFYADNTEQLNLLYDKLNLKQKDVLKFTKKEGIDGSGLFELNYYASEHNINVAKAIQELGFDGIISKGTDIYGNNTDIEYVVYKSNQVKNTTNINPTKSQDIRYAISEVDSNGKILSEQQRKFFKDSKVVDKDGNLLVVYHNTKNKFTVFDKNVIGTGISNGRLGNLGKGFYFTDNSTAYSIENSIKMSAYLDIKKPYYLGEKDNYKQWTSLIKNSQLNYDKSFDLTEATRTFQALGGATGLSGENLLKTFTKLLKQQGFDGIIEIGKYNTDFVVFESNQIKEITNTKPTTNSDIRYALNETQERALKDRGVKGDDLLDAADLSDEILSVGGVITDDAKVVLYHATTTENAKKILESGKMYGKEPNIYFSTKSDGVILGYGNAVIEAQIPLEKLKANDLFDDELHLTIEVKPYQMTNIRYALPIEDNSGTQLTQEQSNYFKDSKIKDEQGRLIKVYHGTDSQFYTFRNKPSVNGRSQGDGFYFATNGEMATEYGGRVITAYLNIKNPFFLHEKRTIQSELEFRGYDIKELASKYGIKLNEFDGINWGKDEKTLLTKMGYDGVVSVWGDTDTITTNADDRTIIVAYKPNQIKEITNKTPTKDTDIRFALAEDEDNRRVGGLTKAQRAKFVANNTKLKVYSRADAEVIINDILTNRLNLDERYVANLSGKSKNEIIDYLFKQLNGANEGYRGTVALKIADYIIENATMEDMYASMYDLVEDTDIELVAYMNKRRHSFDLSGIQGEINYKFDRKNTIALQWGTKKGGLGADQIAQEIEGMGLHTFTAINEADQFFEMLEAYDAANKRLNTKVDKKKLADYGDQAQIDSLRQEIAKDILKSYDSKGTKSKYGKLVEKYTEKIANLRQQVKDVQERNNVLNSLLDRAQKMKDLKLGTFLNATDFKSETFKKSIESLASIKYRGNFNNAGTHRVLSELRQWYSRENPLLENIYNEDVEFMLDTLSRADKNYSTKELKMLRDTMSYFINLVENYNRVYKQGKWIEAIPEAQRYIDVIHSNEQLKVGIFSKLAGSGYMQTFGDPLTVARRMDRYDSSGFYTEMMTELRNATVDSEIAEMEIKSDYNEFLSTNKKYLAEIKKNKVKFNGVEIPKTHLISLYMTMKRSHSHAGLVLNGFSFVDTDGKKVRANGFAPSVTTDAEILTAIADAKIEIENLLSDTDMHFVAILEKGYNVDAKKLKADRDIQRLGFTNATEDYYYPIRRGNIAKNIDTSDIASELDRVSNSSFNKDTVKGAKQELFIESAATVFNRHIKAVTKYAYLSPAIETFNRLYSLDISGNKNKPVSVSTESANTWSKANKYFSKLISDIQGIPSSSSEGMKVLSFIRSSYAKFQLGANPKVWVTQLSSLFASSSMLDTDCIIRGMTVSAKDVDTYCSLAKLRNSDNTVAMAQGLLEKVDKFSNALMTPIGKMDRFVVKRLFGACQVQVEKNGGAKVGTTANKVEAGKLLRNVILETQQNSMATERSAAMRSGNEIMRTITMFSADSMKVAGRVIDSIGELSTLKAKLKNTTDSAARSKILSQIKTAKTKVRKSVTALITSAAFMASVAKLFRWLYKKDEDENTAEVMTVDFIGNLFGGLPVIKEIYGRFAEGYDVDNYAYSAVNDLLDSVQDIYDIIESLSSGNATEQDINKAIKKLSFSAGQILGIPTRNMYNILLGLTKRISPTTAYQFESKIYKKNFVSDLNGAIENDDTAMVNLIMSMILDERVGDDYSEVLTSAMKKLYTSGYSVLPKSIGSSITYNGETITLTNAQQKKIKSVYGKANAYAEKMVLGNTYKGLTEEQQAKALKQLYDAYYSKALQETLGIESDNKLLKMSKYIPIDRIAAINAGISDITSDKTSTGKVVTGSKRSKVIKYLLKQNLTDEQRLLILAFQGYTVNNLEYKGWTTEKVKNRLLRYILSIKTATQAEKIELCEMCGFEVKNGVVVKQSLYSKK